MSEDEEDYEHRRKDRKDRKRQRSASPADHKNNDKLSNNKDQGENNSEADEAHGKGRANGSTEAVEGGEVVDEDLDPEEREKRDREERIAASLRKREEEVAKELSGHLHAREKEREQHRKSEAVSAFQALLTDLIKHPDYSWKEAKKIFKKDSRLVLYILPLQLWLFLQTFDEKFSLSGMTTSVAIWKSPIVSGFSMSILTCLWQRKRKIIENYWMSVNPLHWILLLRISKNLSRMTLDILGNVNAYHQSLKMFVFNLPIFSSLGIQVQNVNVKSSSTST